MYAKALLIQWINLVEDLATVFMKLLHATMCHRSRRDYSIDSEIQKFPVTLLLQRSWLRYCYAASSAKSEFFPRMIKRGLRDKLRIVVHNQTSRTMNEERYIRSVCKQTQINVQGALSTKSLQPDVLIADKSKVLIVMLWKCAPRLSTARRKQIIFFHMLGTGINWINSVVSNLNTPSNPYADPDQQTIFLY